MLHLTRRMVTLAVATATLTLAAAQAATAGPLQDDLVQRRARVMEKLGPDTLFVVWSAPEQVYSMDVDYEYRQDSNMLYLTGVEQEGTILVLMPGNKTKKSILFVHEPNPTREHWTGHLLTRDEAKALSGVDAVEYVSQFDAFIANMFSQMPYRLGGPTGAPGTGAAGAGGGMPGAPRVGGTGAEEFETFFKAVADGHPKLALMFGPRPQSTAPLTRPYEFARDLRDRVLNVTFVDAQQIVYALRQVKTPFEQTAMRQSVDISSDAHMAGMRATAPGKYEYQVRAAIEHVYMDRGAMIWGYPSIVGSGPNSLVLHYTADRRKMEAGDLLLVDAAASYQGMTGDITRTYPVSGRFTPAQKDIYRICLVAQDAGRKVAAAGKTVADIRDAISESLKAGLLELALITDTKGDQFRRWATHGPVHWIGMDVHDVGNVARPLEPGMMFVMEPGVYIRQAALDTLPDTPENRAWKEQIAPAFQKYKGIGVRIEDSFLLGESGLVSLSAKVPRTIEEIEAFFAKESSTAKAP